MTSSVAGTLTSRSPPGAHASIRAAGTRAHTSAVHPAGTISVRRIDSDPPPLPAGTVRATPAPPAPPAAPLAALVLAAQAAAARLSAAVPAARTHQRNRWSRRAALI